MFIILLTIIVSACSHTKCVSLSNQKCITRHTFINLHHNQYSQKPHYHPFAIDLNRCAGTSDTLGQLCIEL